MKNRKIVSFLLTVLIGTVTLQAQSDTLFNQTDSRNLKQGYWKKSYPNGFLIYKGFFKDDKPVGEMRRYFESGALKATLIYDKTGTYAHARLYYEDGNLAAEGSYFNALKDSNWVYYSYYDKTVTSREFYERGIRHGMMINYYSNGEPSERIEWKNDKKSGIWEQFYQGNKLKLKTIYVDNKLEGEFLVYHPDGKPYVTGAYLKNLRQGKWTFYNAEGTVQQELNYANDRAIEEQKLNEEQQEFFRLMDENQGKFEEPDETNFLSPQPK